MTEKFGTNSEESREGLHSQAIITALSDQSLIWGALDWEVQSGWFPLSMMSMILEFGHKLCSNVGNSEQKLTTGNYWCKYQEHFSSV